MAQMVKNLPAMQETQVQSLGWEASLKKVLSLAQTHRGRPQTTSTRGSLFRASKTFGFPGRGWYSQAHGPSRLLMGTGRHSEGSEPYASTPFPIDSFRVHQLHLGARKLMQRPRPHAGTWSGGDFK